MIDIEALARQCITEDWNDNAPGYYREMNLVRFAALVARECAAACEREAWNHASTPFLGPELNRLHCAKTVLAAFPMPKE